MRVLPVLAGIWLLGLFAVSRGIAGDAPACAWPTPPIVRSAGHGLLGPVSGVEEQAAFFYRKSSLWEQTPHQPVSIARYDAEKRLCETQQYTANGAYAGYETFTYTDQGRVEAHRRYDADDQLTTCRYFRYNALGQLVEIAQCDGDEFPETITTCAYDAEGRVAEVHVYTAGDLGLLASYTYAEQGAMGVEEFNSAGGQLDSRTVFSYSPEGRVVEVAEFAADGTPCDRVEYSYDADGRIGEMLLHRAEWFDTIRTVYTYDEAGRKRGETSFTEDGGVRDSANFAYDPHGNLLVVSRYQGGELVMSERFSYEYDVCGNWVAKTTTRWIPGGAAFEPVVIAYRTITYR